MENIIILKKEPGKDIELLEIESSLSSMQGIVKGSLAVSSLLNNIDMWYNDEFLYYPELNANLILHSDVIHGNVFFAAHDNEGNTVSLTVHQIETIKAQLKKPISSPLPIYLNVPNEHLKGIEKAFQEMGEL